MIEMQHVQEIPVYIKEVTKPDAKKLSSRLNEDALAERTDNAGNVYTIHHSTVSEWLNVRREMPVHVILKM